MAYIGQKIKPMKQKYFSPDTKNPHLMFYSPVSLILLQYALSFLALYFSSSFHISKY